MDPVQFIKRTGLDNLNVVIFQVTIRTEKATLRVINKKNVVYICGFKNNVLKGWHCFQVSGSWTFRVYFESILTFVCVTERNAILQLLSVQ